MSKQRRRVLIFRTGTLGDTVCAIPAFRLVRQSFPDAELVLLSDTNPRGISARDVAMTLGIFDTYLEYTARRGLRSIVSLMVRVLGNHPDVAVLLPQGRETAPAVHQKRRIFRLCGIDDVRAVQMPRAGDSLLPNEAGRLISLLNSVGIEGYKPTYSIPVNEESRENIQRRLAEAGIHEDEPFVLFCGGGKAATQRWALGRYAAVLAQVSDETGVSVVGIGSEADRVSYEREMRETMPSLRFLKTSSVAELFEACRLSLLYLGNDTGPMHATAAVGRPVAVVMSGRNPKGEWDPDVEPRLVIREPVDCEDCFLAQCVEHEHRCMRLISVDRVVAELRPFVERVHSEFQQSLLSQCAE